MISCSRRSTNCLNASTTGGAQVQDWKVLIRNAVIMFSRILANCRQLFGDLCANIHTLQGDWTF